MKQMSNISQAAIIALAAVYAGHAQAQENGYVNGVFSLFSFSTSSGALLNSLSGAGTAEPFAVAADGVTLYLPYYGLPAEAIFKVSGQTGQTAGSLAIAPLVYNGLALTKNGTTAYVITAGGVSVVNTATFTITGSIQQIGQSPYDVALSPDDSTLYMSVDCLSCSPSSACPLTYGVCAFDTSTLSLEWAVKNVSGLLSVSNDGSSLYLAGVPGARPIYPLSVINTSTRAVTNLGISTLKDSSAVRIITDPVSPYAVVIEENATPTLSGPITPASAYLLNTSTNKFVETLFTSAPGGMVVSSVASGAAFSPDGKSVWMLLSCGAGRVPNCSDETGQIYLAGFSLPSGALISDQPVPGEFWGDNDGYAVSIAFPR